MLDLRAIAARFVIIVRWKMRWQCDFLAKLREGNHSQLQFAVAVESGYGFQSFSSSRGEERLPLNKIFPSDALLGIRSFLESPLCVSCS
jgi:hypothetical protein